MPIRSPAQRPTEGSRKGAIARGQGPRVGRGGRPKGSKTKPKGLIPLPLVEDIISALQPVLPPDQIRYLKSVIKDGGAIDTRKELDTLILLVNRSIWPALANEAIPLDKESVEQALNSGDGDDEPETETGTTPKPRPTSPLLRRDVTDRLKVLNSFLNLRAALDKAETAKADDEEQPILKLFAQRGMDTRIAVLVNDPKPALPAGDEIVIDQEQ